MLRFFYYVTLSLLMLGQFTNLSKSEGANFYLFDFAVIGISFVNLIYLLGVAKKFKVPTAFFFLVGFIFIGAVSLLLNSYKYNESEISASAFYVIRYIAYLVFALTVYNLVLIKKLSKEEVLNSFVYSGVFLVFAGILQLIFLPDFEQLDPLLGWDPHKNRLASTFFDPNFAGAYLVAAIICLFDKLSKQKIKKLDIVLLIILLAGIVLTFSRSTWLMLAIIILIYGLFRNRVLLFISLVLMFLAYYSVPRIQTRISGTTDPADSAQFRFESWSNTMQIIKDQPLFGVGYNTLRYVQKDYGFTTPDTFLKHSASGSDSSVLFVLATSGIFGLLFFLTGILFPFSSNLKSAFIYKLLIIALLIEGQFINSLFYPQILFLWMILLAFSYL